MKNGEPIGEKKQVEETPRRKDLVDYCDKVRLAPFFFALVDN